MMYMILYILIICIIVLAYIYYFYTPNKVVENMQQKNYIPSKLFVGEKKGYVFKNCSLGLGYYIDSYKN
jgi:hypothetical protein